MHRFYLLCLSLLLVAGAGNTQLLSSKSWRGDTNKIYVRWSPIGLIDLYDGNISIGGEYRLNKTWSATLDAGYIFYSVYMINTKKARGVLLRPGIRLYAGKYKDMIIDFQFHYKETMYHIQDWLGKGLVNNVPSYEERKVFRYHKEVLGWQVTVGGREYLTKNRRFFLEAYAGLGIHFKKEGLYQEPDSRYNRGFLSAPRNSDEVIRRVVPALPGGIRLVYALK